MNMWKRLIFCNYEQGVDILLSLLENPILVSTSTSFKENIERKFSVSEESFPERSKLVYLFQKEYATVDPAFVDVCNFLTLCNILLFLS